VTYANGDVYEGEVVNGVTQGKGILQLRDGRCYEGDIIEGKLHGEGRFYVKNGTYQMEGKFTDGIPEVEANKYQFELLSPIDDGTDVRASKDKKLPTATATDEDFTGN
jgi:hypothetical protein